MILLKPSWQDPSPIDVPSLVLTTLQNKSVTHSPEATAEFTCWQMIKVQRETERLGGGNLKKDLHKKNNMKCSECGTAMSRGSLSLHKQEEKIHTHAPVVRDPRVQMLNRCLCCCCDTNLLEQPQQPKNTHTNTNTKLFEISTT
jgi:hypothetical protein